MVLEQRSSGGRETNEIVQTRFHNFVIPGDRSFDTGEVCLLFPELVDRQSVPAVKIRLANTLKSGCRHTGDFACVTVRTVVDPHSYVRQVVIDAVCFDGLTSPDFTGENLAPDSQASKMMIEGANSPNFQRQIEALYNVERSSDFDLYNCQQRPPYYRKAQAFSTREDWKIVNVRGHEFDVKKHFRNKHTQWMVDKLQHGPIQDKHPVHWYAGVYGIFHIVVDPHDKLIHYLFLGSGDVEAKLFPRSNPRQLHEDTNWSADEMAKKLVIGGADRYPGKVYQIYDVVGPLSGERVGPFTASIGYEKSVAGFELRTDGYRFEQGKDDVTSIRISAYA